LAEAFSARAAAAGDAALLALGFDAAVAVVLLPDWATGLPRCRTGRSGSFSSGGEAGEDGALACGVASLSVGRDEVVDEEGAEFFSVGRSESSLDGGGGALPLEEVEDPPEEAGVLPWFPLDGSGSDSDEPLDGARRSTGGPESSLPSD